MRFFNMDWPKCIREFVGMFIAYKERVDREREREKVQKPMFDWLVDKLVDKVIEGWYTHTKQTDPTLLTKEGVRKHVRWWTSWRKDDEFFRLNNVIPISKLDDDICHTFQEQFPDSNMVASVFFYNHKLSIRKAVEDKIRKEIF